MTKIDPTEGVSLDDGDITVYDWQDEVSSRSHKTFEDLVPLFERDDSGRFVFEIRREADDGRTFSREALEDLARGFLSFVAVRCHAHWKATGEPARKMRVGVIIVIEEP